MRVSFLIILGAVTALFLYVVRRFIMPALLAAITAALFRPLRSWMVRMTGDRYQLAVALTMIIVSLVFVLPVGAVGYLTVDNLIAIVTALQRNVDSIEAVLGNAVDSLETLPLFRHMNLDAAVNRETLLQLLQGIPGNVLNRLGVVVTTTANLLLLVFVYVYCLYFFLKDGDRIVKAIFDRIPLGDIQKETLRQRFVSTSRATIKGTFIIGVFQGVLGGLTVYAVGLPGALVLGVLLVFLAAIPNFGAVLVWLPSAVVLFATGRPIRGIVMILVGGGLVAAVDYLLRPRLIGQDVQVHQVLIFFGVIGGVIVFGVFGLIIGPIVVAVFVKMWELYSEVFRSELAYVAGDEDQDEGSRREQGKREGRGPAGGVRE